MNFGQTKGDQCSSLEYLEGLECSFPALRDIQVEKVNIFNICSYLFVSQVPYMVLFVEKTAFPW